MTTELKLHKKYEAGLRYLLAQSPDSRGLVPDTEESAWERIGTKNHVEVRVCLPLPPCFLPAFITACSVAPSLPGTPLGAHD